MTIHPFNPPEFQTSGVPVMALSEMSGETMRPKTSLNIIHMLLDTNPKST